MSGSGKAKWFLGGGLLAGVLVGGFLLGPDRIRAAVTSIYDVKGIIAWGGYVALAVIVFAETGLLVGFFLPGDSLLVAAGVFAALGVLDLLLLNALLIPLAIAGDAVNYMIGRRTGPAIFRREDGIFFKRAHLERAHRFYERYGGKTIVFARFLPIVRTFAPFAAGMASMPYRRFALFNVAGAVAWVGSMTVLGYALGQVADIERHIHVVVAAVIAVSFVPGLIEVWRERRRLRREGERAVAEAAATMARADAGAAAPSGRDPGP